MAYTESEALAPNKRSKRDYGEAKAVGSEYANFFGEWACSHPN